MLFFHNVSTRRDLLPQAPVPPTTRLFNRLIACPLIVRQTESDMITIYTFFIMLICFYIIMESMTCPVIFIQILYYSH